MSKTVPSVPLVREKSFARQYFDANRERLTSKRTFNPGDRVKIVSQGRPQNGLMGTVRVSGWVENDVVDVPFQYVDVDCENGDRAPFSTWELDHV
jgi:hypothetical protein